MSACSQGSFLRHACHVQVSAVVNPVPTVPGGATPAAVGAYLPPENATGSTLPIQACLCTHSKSPSNTMHQIGFALRTVGCALFARGMSLKNYRSRSLSPTATPAGRECALHAAWKWPEGKLMNGYCNTFLSISALVYTLAHTPE